jgi:hypothetical protein
MLGCLEHLVQKRLDKQGHKMIQGCFALTLCLVSDQGTMSALLLSAGEGTWLSGHDISTVGMGHELSLWVISIARGAKCGWRTQPEVTAYSKTCEQCRGDNAAQASAANRDCW